MARLKLLVITGDFSRYVDQAFHYLMMETAKIADLTLWYKPGNIQEILATLERQPDFILINEYGETNTPVITGLESLEIPHAIYMHDIHYRIETQKEAIRKLNLSCIFSRVKNRFHEWYPEFSHLFRWLPHCVNTEVFRDYGFPKEIDWLLMGSVHHAVYPIRYKVLQVMKDKPGFVYHPHPGYRDFTDSERKTVFIEERYAKEINRAKMFFTCDSKFHYPVKKYYEVLACNTLLLAADNSELKDLGFISGVHFIPINEGDIEEKAEYYLRHKDEREEIARHGYRLVHDNHSTVIRANQLVTIIWELLEKE